MNHYSHRPYLQKELDGLDLSKKTTILELGMGNGSSELIHNFCKENKSVRAAGFDNHDEWFNKIKNAFTLPNYSFHLIPDWSNIVSAVAESLGNKTDQFDIVFVDCAPWSARIDCMDLLSAKTKVFILHDYDYYLNDSPNFFTNKYGKEYNIEEYTQDSPPTLIMRKKDDTVLLRDRSKRRGYTSQKSTFRHKS